MSLSLHSVIRLAVGTTLLTVIIMSGVLADALVTTFLVVIMTSAVFVEALATTLLLLQLEPCRRANSNINLTHKKIID